MLRSRLLAGSFLAFGVTAGLYVDMVFNMDCIALAMITTGMTLVLHELYCLCRQRGLTPFVRFGVIIGVFLMLLRWLSLPGTLDIFLNPNRAPVWLTILVQWAFSLGLAVAIFGALWLQATKRDNAATFESISITLFGLLYVIFLGGFMLDIRRLGSDGIPGGISWHSTGALYLLITIGITKLCDVGAFTAGNLFGKHKMIPRISPKKTYEGAVGGVLFGVVSAVIFHMVGIFPLPGLGSVVLFAVVVSIVGMYGDLAESLLKRGSGSKDAGAIVPGFGGILDVADSLLVSAPVAYLLLVIILGR